MSASIAEALKNFKRRCNARLERWARTGQDKGPVLGGGGKIHYEMADRARAVNCGGVGAMLQLAEVSGLRAAIDRHGRRRSVGGSATRRLPST